MKLTTHQKRIIAAMYELGAAHSLRWWSRDSIGSVVDAGGYHQIIQVRSMEALHDHGMVITERESWPEDVRRLVQCNCACFQWGLTAPGVAIAEDLNVRWSEEAKQSIQRCGLEKTLRDRVVSSSGVEKSQWRHFRYLDDEEEQDG